MTSQRLSEAVTSVLMISDVRLVLQIASTKEERAWARMICREKHYMRQEINGRARPLYYLVIREVGTTKDDHFIAAFRERVGMIAISRMQSSRCLGWYGNLVDVARGQAKHTQWQMLTLSRCWLDPTIQKHGPCYIPQAASKIIRKVIETVAYDYLLAYPPAFPEQPWEIQELISYCDTKRFNCMLYLFSRFKFKRENTKGLRTYVRSLAPLSDEQRRHILQASRFRKDPRAKRQEKAISTIIHEVLFRHRKAREMRRAA